MRSLDVVVTESDEVCGGVVYWSLSGEVSFDALYRAWASEGLSAETLPTATTSERALRRAVDALRDRQHIVRRLPDGSGYALHAAHEVDAKTERLEPTLKVWLEAGQLVIEPAGHPDAEHVLDAYEAALASFDPNDISDLLIRTCKRLQAVSLRALGGIYFVPAPKMAELERTVRALEACSGNRVWKLPAMRSSDAARAVLAAVTEEAEAEVARVEEELGRDDCIGGRAIATREQKMRALRVKVSEYEALLGGSLDEVRDRLERVQATLAAAALAADIEKEGA